LHPTTATLTTTNQINAMSSPVETIRDRRPSDFLSLAPATSASYPQQPKSRLTSAALEQLVDGQAAKPRTGSMSSDGNKSAGLRFLKLGPVHFGEHRSESQSDWHDAVVE